METNKIIAQLKEDCRSCASNSLCRNGRLQSGWSGMHPSTGPA